MEHGSIIHWKTLPAPPVAINYWRLPVGELRHLHTEVFITLFHSSPDVTSTSICTYLVQLYLVRLSDYFYIRMMRLVLVEVAERKSLHEVFSQL